MTADHQTRHTAPIVALVQPSRRRLREIARRGLWWVARPYARRRARDAEVAASVGRLEAELEHVRERHTEQIDRLEELVRELVLTAESLRRAIPPREDGGRD
jgi:hypothetical protein